MRCVLMVTVLFLSLGVSRGVAAAGVPDKPAMQTPLTPREKLRRNALVRDGEKLVQAGQWREASAKFQEALAMQPDPESFLWAGFAEDKLGHLMQAKALYLRAHTAAADGKLSDWVERSEQALSELQKRMPRILVSLPAGVTGRLSIDEAEVDLHAEGVEVNPGKHSISVSAPGRLTYQTELAVEEAQSYTLQPPSPKFAPPPPPVVVVDTPKPETSLVGPLAVMIAGAALGGVGGGLVGTSDKSDMKAVGGTALGLGVVGVLGGTIWLIRQLGSEPAAPASGAPAGSSVALDFAPLPGGGWATVAGRF